MDGELRRAMMPLTFAAFTADVAEVLRDGGGVDTVAGLVRELVSTPNWLDADRSRPVAGKPYSQYLLHLADDASWSVVSFVWPAGSTTPVHDHGCWGVVGVYQGEETETTYRLLSGDRETGPVSLEKTATAVMRSGDVSTILPPDDVHAVSNRGGGTAISIHVYGANIGLHPRHTFDPQTGAVRRFVSGYDEPGGEVVRTTSRNASP